MGVTPPLLTESDLDALASDFLQSHYVGSIYADWSPDRRLDVFLRRRGLVRVANDGDLSHNVLERIMDRGRATMARH
ncbi:hypothetical protein DQP58_11180 [Mycobacterium colombiense]|jgi:hypothetical protein|uniref:Uncharacterized protein n=1 Tax=Mycobacterium colombiense TaxID=339268 RepID=A0A329KV96_9MYCO|nr:hypothetical protein DQP58_11180 [Mycobacterium colombiense]